MKINYGYFRHRLDASDDPKLQALIDDLGIAALGYYFSLLEMFGRKYNQRDKFNRVEIHRRVVANTWRKRVDSCDKVLTKLQLSDLLVYTKCKNTYLIDIPNYSKYFGIYKKTELEKVPNKRKVKESKVKEKKVNSRAGETAVISEFVHDVINHLNIKASKKYKPDNKKTISLINARQNENYTLDQFKHVIDVKVQEWLGTDMEKFIRPDTLFGNKFENYVNQEMKSKVTNVNRKLINSFKENPYE